MTRTSQVRDEGKPSEIGSQDSMSRLSVFPVVHVQGLRQAVEQSRLALEAGADGIFLIDHGIVGQTGLIESYEKVRAAFPDAFIGLNMLNGGPIYAYQALALAEADGELTTVPDAVWVDDVRGAGVLTHPDDLPALRGDSRPLLYGGVAFKYTPTFTDEPVAARAELQELDSFVDVPTTSGAGTGKAPAPQKLRAMKEALGSRRLAVASGITSENLHNYLGTVDDILVASSIEIEPYSGEFDPAALKRMVRAVRTASA